MKSVVKFIMLIGLIAGLVFVINSQRTKLKGGNTTLEKKPRGYTIEELQQQRDRIIKNIQTFD